MVSDKAGRCHRPFVLPHPCNRHNHRASDHYLPIHAIVITIGLLTIIYATLVKWVTNLKLFAYQQITVDIALITAIVYVTGGIESYLSIMYFLSVIGGSILLNRKGGFYAASVASIAFGLLVDLDFYQVLPENLKLLWSPVEPSWEEAVTTIVTHILALFTVAYLAGYLAEKTAKIEKRLEEKEIDFERLEYLNRHIVENIASGIMTLDSNWMITSFNTAAERLTGYSLRDVYYRNVDDIFPGIVKEVLKGAGYRARFEMACRIQGKVRDGLQARVLRGAHPRLHHNPRTGRGHGPHVYIPGPYPDKGP
jgi:two-component system sensor histidine kinase PilS (NtrC family)